MSKSEFTVASYNKHLSDGEIMASQCEGCRILYLPPRPVCPQCQSREMRWRPLKGEGKVLGFTVISIVPTTMAKLGYGRDNPYVTALVQMDEGPSVTGLLERVDAGKPGSVKVGMPVAAEILETEEGDEKPTTLVFRPK